MALVQAFEDGADTRSIFAGIKLSIENTPLTGPADFNELFSILEKTGLDKIGLTGRHGRDVF